MKDLTDEHRTALLAAAEELAAEYAEITMTQTVAAESAAVAAKLAIDKTMMQTKEALARYTAAAEAAHQLLVSRMSSRTREFLGLNGPAEITATTTIHPDADRTSAPTPTPMIAALGSHYTLASKVERLPPLADEFRDPEGEAAA